MAMTSTPRRILVTGAAGHVGARLVRRLAARGDVTLRTAVRVAGDPDLSALGETAAGDLRDRGFCADATAECDAVVHLAGVSPQARDDEAADAENMAENLLAAASRHGVARFVHLSSVHVHGRMLRGLVDETTPADPLTPYGAAHLRAERVIQSFRGSSPSRLILRCANAFGASPSANTAQWSLVVGDLCTQAARGSVLTLRSHGRHQRDFVTLTDVVRAIEFFSLDCDAAGLLLLGSGRSVTLREVADLVAARARIVFGGDYTVECEDDATPALEYRLDTRRLRGTGFDPLHDCDSEIDGMLAAAARLVGR